MKSSEREAVLERADLSAFEIVNAYGSFLLENLRKDFPERVWASYSKSGSDAPSALGDILLNLLDVSIKEKDPERRSVFDYEAHYRIVDMSRGEVYSGIGRFGVSVAQVNLLMPPIFKPKAEVVALDEEFRPYIARLIERANRVSGLSFRTAS